MTTRCVLLFIVLLIVWTGFAVSSAAAQVYYVDGANGDDANLGTSSAPWKTIQKAADTIEAGSTAIVRAGTYNERVDVSRSGSPGNVMTFQAENTVVMQGFTMIADYVRITGFEITNSIISYVDGTGIALEGQYDEILNNYIHDILFGQGVWLYGGPNRDASYTSNCTVRGNRIVHTRVAGIQVEGTNNLIESNDISHTVEDPPGAPPRPGSDANGLYFFGSGHIMRHNYIHDITLSDLGNPGPHIDAFQTWGPASNIVIEQNMIWQMESPDQGITIEGLNQPVDNITVSNNIFMTSGTGYAPAVLAGDVGAVANVNIVNNTVVGLNGPTEYAFWLFANLTTAVVKNNALYDHGKGNEPYIRIDPGASGLDIGFNSISKSDGQPPQGSPYPGDLWMVDPQFVDFLGRDFRLSSTSPLVDAGFSLMMVPDDFDGVLRPQGCGFDIGAYER